MSKDDYFKFFVQEDTETLRRKALLMKGIKNSDKIAKRPVGYRYGKRYKMLAAIQKKTIYL